MDQTYYATIAQVIPLLLLTGVVEMRFFDNFRTMRPSGRRGWLSKWVSPLAYHRMSVLFLAFVFGGAVLGLIAAMSCTQDKKQNAFTENAAVIGLVCSLVFVLTPVIDRLRRMWREAPQEGSDY